MVEHAGQVEASQAIGRGRRGDAPPNLFVDVGRVLVLEVAQVELLEVDLATVDLDRLDRGRAGRVGQGDDEHEAVAGLGRVERDAFGAARVGGSADSSPRHPHPVVVAERQVVEGRGVEIGLLEWVVLAVDLLLHIGPEHRGVGDTDLEPGVRVGGQAVEEDARPAGGGDAVESGLADTDCLPLIAPEDRDVGRPVAVPDAARPPGIVRSRRHQDGDGSVGQGSRQARHLGLGREVAVEGVARDHDCIDAVFPSEPGDGVGLGRHVLATLRPPPRVLDVLEARRQVDVRRVQDLH